MNSNDEPAWSLESLKDLSPILCLLSGRVGWGGKLLQNLWRTARHSEFIHLLRTAINMQGLKLLAQRQTSCQSCRNCKGIDVLSFFFFKPLLALYNCCRCLRHHTPRMVCASAGQNAFQLRSILTLGWVQLTFVCKRGRNGLLASF